MAVSAKQKEYSKKWDKANMGTLGVKLRREDADKFKSYCAAQGLTVNAVLQQFVFSKIGKGEAD